MKNGSKGARTPDLSRVRRTLIPAELCFHGFYYSTIVGKSKWYFRKERQLNKVKNYKTYGIENYVLCLLRIHGILSKEAR